jgi:hypothetical protein
MNVNRREEMARKQQMRTLLLLLHVGGAGLMSLTVKGGVPSFKESAESNLVAADCGDKTRREAEDARR